MISEWLGRAPPTHFAHALHRETEGNPFFIEEVLRHLIEVDAVEGTEWRRLASFTELGIPDGVREAIERRLAALSPAARRTVTMAAAIGRSFSIAVLDALAELPGDRLLEALEEAAERRIVEEESRCPGPLHLRPRADSRDALRVAERAPASRAAPPDRRDPRTAARRRHRAASRRARVPLRRGRRARIGGQGRRLLGPRGPAGAGRAGVRGGRRPFRPRPRGPAAVAVPRRGDPLRAAARPRRGPRQGERVRRQPRRLPSRRGARANGRPRGALRPCRARPRPGLDRAGHRRPGDHRAATRRRSPRCPRPVPRSGPGCSAASPWSFTSPTSPSAARRWRGRPWRSPGELGDPSTLAFALNAHHWAQRGQDEVGELLAIADEIIRHAEASAELELALQGHSWRLVDLLELGRAEEIDDEIAACVGSRRSPRPAVLSILGRRAAPDARAHAGPLRRRRAARRGSARGGRVGGQLERHHRVEGPARVVLEGHRARRRPGRRGRALRAATRCSPGRCQAARPRCGTATSPCSWPRPASRPGRASTSTASPTATTPS